MEQKIIQEIRDDFSPQKNTARILKTLAPSIKTLAEDLYAKETHFIFELIQNAEDNSYEDISSPTLRFVLKKADSLVESEAEYNLIVENNEVGFHKNNVEAICSVGSSTKEKNLGYIGEKGIGFKSVFRVTSCPYIFSNGFRFSLPEKDDFSGLGYIVPSWLDCIPAEADPKITSIYLPLDKTDFPVDKVVNSLKDVAPETIIFLKQLDTFEISVELEEKYEIVIEKDSSEFPLVRLSYLKRDSEVDEIVDEQLFWVNTITFYKPEDASHNKRANIDSREVSVAIPLNGKPKGKLFAYLPVWEDTGLPFLINADFLLVSSRESVKEGVAWNDWLRDCIAEVYVESLLSCLTSKRLSFEQQIKVYASIPKVTKQEYLEPVVTEIQRKLKETPCIYTVHNNELAIPSATRIIPKDFWQLLEGDDLPVALSDRVQVVRRELKPYQKIFRELGVVSLKDSDVLACLEDASWLRGKSDEWFLNLFRYLGKLKTCSPSTQLEKMIELLEEGGDFRLTIQNKKIVKIWQDKEQNSILSCCAEQPIYFECDNDSRRLINATPAWLSQKVPVVFLDKAFWRLLGIQEDREMLMEWMTSNLKIHPFSKSNYCADILNFLTSKYESLTTKQVIETTSFLVDYSDDDSISLSALPLVLSSGDIKEISLLSNVLVPANYDTDSGWQYIWDTKEEHEKFQILDDRYDKKVVNYFLKHHSYRVIEFPAPPKFVNNTYYNIYEDYKAPVWMIEEESVSNRKCEALLKWAKNNKIQSYGYKHYSRPDGRYNFCLEEAKPSQFQERLRDLSWFPTSKGNVSPKIAFLDKTTTREILGETVAYCLEEISEESIELLGIKSELTIDDLLNILKDTCTATEVSREMIYRVYMALDNRIQAEQIDSEHNAWSTISRTNGEVKLKIVRAFTSGKLVFIPCDGKKGKWYSLEDVIWEDSEKSLGNDFEYLQKYYPKLKGFFTETLGVKLKADPESFARRWLSIQEVKDYTPHELREIFEPIYKVLLPIAQGEVEKPSWWNDFVAEAKILSQRGIFINAECMVVPDDGELKKVFAKANVEFVWRPEKDSFNKWASFYEVFGVSRISELVKSSLISNNNMKPKGHNEYITQSMVEMLATWLREKDEKQYKELFENKIFHNLRDLSEVDIDDEIKICFSLETAEVYEEVEGEYPVFWDHQKKLLIINKSGKELDVKRGISVEIARGLMNNRAFKDLAHWVELILSTESTKRVQAEGWSVPNEIKKLFRVALESPRKSKKKSEEQSLQSNEKSVVIDSKVQESDNNSREQSQLENATVDEHEFKSSNSEKRTISSQNWVNPESSSRESEGENTTKTPDVVNVNGDKNHSENIIDKIDEAFNRSGETTLSEDIDEDDYYSQGNVKNPSRRRDRSIDKIRNRIAKEPQQNKRRQETVLSILEPVNPETRSYLLNLYSGKCQICGDTFPQRDGTPFFIANHIVERKHARFLDDPANAMSLCPLHFAQWKHGTVEVEEKITDQIFSKKTKAEGGHGDISLQIKLCGKDCKIFYKEKHIVDLQALLSELRM